MCLRILPHGVDEARAWLFHATQVLEDQPDGTVLVRFSSSGMRELSWHLFTWGDKVEILQPDRLKQEMRDGLERCRLGLDSSRTTDTDASAG